MIRHQNTCIVCDEGLGHIWLAGSHRIPDYFCAACFEKYCRDEAGAFVPNDRLPEWLRYLWRQETARRVRRHRARKAGHDHEATPFSLLMVNHPILDYDQHTDRSLDEIFEDLGEIVI